ncbi:MAG: HAD family hydrolase, partial [Patescibacteria group bacterium]
MIKAIFVDCGGTLFFVNGNNEPLLDFIRRHQNKYRFCIISDTTLDLEPSLHFFKIRDLFELVLTSGTTGFSKDKP